MHKLIHAEGMKIIGIMGDGSKTTELWEAFEEKAAKIKLAEKSDGSAYEIRFDYDNKCDCFVGYIICDSSQPFSHGETTENFKALDLPQSEYAVFDVVAAKGYDSENENMSRWLEENSDKYIQATLDNKHYILEVYNKRFDEGIVEMWIPLIRRNK